MQLMVPPPPPHCVAIGSPPGLVVLPQVDRPPRTTYVVVSGPPQT